MYCRLDHVCTCYIPSETVYAIYQKIQSDDIAYTPSSGIQSAYTILG